MMPAEDHLHRRTWMCWPSNRGVWGSDLRSVQDTIVDIALTIAEFEPVAMLARPEELRPIRPLLPGVELVEAPVDDLWARDTLPNFLIRKSGRGGASLAASHARFNGWGGKQIATGDAQLAKMVAKRLRIELFDSGLVGEGGGIEVDGAGTVLAARSCWVNPNRNPGKSTAQVERAILAMLGAQRMVWIDGLAGHDITDGHIDTLARFVDAETIIIDKPAFNDSSDPWVRVAARTAQQIGAARTAKGSKYRVVDIVQPATTRASNDDFLSTYMNFYVCNGGVIAPKFGDRSADAAAKVVLQRLFPGRDVVQIDIDPLAAGGGGIHCATQQQPAS
jgi:agmatine deiminase